MTVSRRRGPVDRLEFRPLPFDRPERRVRLTGPNAASFLTPIDWLACRVTRWRSDNRLLFRWRSDYRLLFRWWSGYRLLFDGQHRTRPLGHVFWHP